MKQPELPLYPKLSSIYNKIMQLAIAIVFIIILMNIWLSISVQNKYTVQQHFNEMGHSYIKQAGISISLLLTDKKSKMLHDYVNQLSVEDFVKSVHLYDAKGQLITHSTSAQSINDLYGISPHKINRSEQYVPFVHELRTDKLQGYLRLNIERSYLTDKLEKSNESNQQLLRLMLILAGFVGFLLTRGLNRFSRQGFRLDTSNKD